MLVFYVAIGGAFGAVCRYLLGGWIGSPGGGLFPWATLIVNVVGSFVMGALAAWLSKALPAHQAELRALLAVGVLGGFTTFSAFSLETALLAEKGQWVLAAGYVIASVLLCVAALLGGLAMVRAV